jgi:hypothetical protein
LGTLPRDYAENPEKKGWEIEAGRVVKKNKNVGLK